jgi:hypothetical protein
MTPPIWEDIINRNPLKFLDTIVDFKHIVLFYEKPESGRAIQFRFIRNGLLKGQHCIYTSHKDMDIPLIENEMTNSGIDVEGYKKTKLLHICQIPDPGSFREGSVKGYDSIVKGEQFIVGIQTAMKLFSFIEIMIPQDQLAA